MKKQVLTRTETVEIVQVDEDTDLFELAQWADGEVVCDATTKQPTGVYMGMTKRIIPGMVVAKYNGQGYATVVTMEELKKMGYGGC